MLREKQVYSNGLGMSFREDLIVGNEVWMPLPIFIAAATGNLNFAAGCFAAIGRRLSKCSQKQSAVREPLGLAESQRTAECTEQTRARTESRSISAGCSISRPQWQP